MMLLLLPPAAQHAWVYADLAVKNNTAQAGRHRIGGRALIAPAAGRRLKNDSIPAAQSTSGTTMPEQEDRTDPRSGPHTQHIEHISLAYASRWRRPLPFRRHAASVTSCRRCSCVLEARSPAVL
eukprot:NODE_12801_length_1203_cov_2.928439.p2 GENE.NODE_12801_length_1203_cov_2.928439~~NODE_12801_length_1203_cov_2.928439.p2  ORF type:complete len:124 (+),score=32.04 NODE_12801_length_1203_cov_2.928439:248-619(+)